MTKVSKGRLTQSIVSLQPFGQGVLCMCEEHVRSLDNNTDKYV